MRKRDILFMILIILVFIGTLYFSFNDLENHLIEIGYVEAVR